MRKRKRRKKLQSWKLKTVESEDARTEINEELEREMKKKDISDTTCAVSEAAEKQAKLEVRVLKSVTKKDCFIRDTFVQKTLKTSMALNWFCSH